MNRRALLSDMCILYVKEGKVAVISLKRLRLERWQGSGDLEEVPMKEDMRVAVYTLWICQPNIFNII
jgi:hypothetical protein